MASIRIPKPGTEYGPCVEACAHQDCAESRNDAAERCGLCGSEIGYNVDYYTDREDGKRIFKHAKCAYIKARS